ncbi:hypothetical protein FACS1894122_01680 [Alphaproteobacteria bacterium]|nr:hypothetical protein FACS1894122_01680 [Alphaproteobacteria bacterium]
MGFVHTANASNSLRNVGKYSSSANLTNASKVDMNTFTIDQYQELVKKFYAQNGLGKPINIRGKMVVDGLLYIIDMLKLKEKDVNGRKIKAIDLSWPNIRDMFKEKFYELKFEEKKAWRDRATRLMKLIEATEEISHNNFSLTRDQVYEILDLCLRGECSLFDIRQLSSDLQPHFKRHLCSMLEDYTGFQRLMSLLAVSVLNSTTAHRFRRSEYFNRIGVAENNEKCKQSIRETGNCYWGKSLWIKKNTLKGNEYRLEKSGTYTTILHELTHAYHDMLGARIKREVVVPNIFDSSGSYLLGLLFPALIKNEMDAAVKEIEKCINERIGKSVDNVKSNITSNGLKTIKSMFKAIIDCGFGGIFFSKNDTNPKMENMLKKETLAKAIYVYCYAIRDSAVNPKDVKESESMFGNCEEMLTMFGLAPILYNNQICLIEDRQNEEIHKIRHQENLKNYEECNNQFRFHMGLDKEHMIENIAKKINEIFKGISGKSTNTDTSMLKKRIPDPLKPKTLRFSRTEKALKSKKVAKPSKKTAATKYKKNKPQNYQQRYR